jgi:DNA-binding ferritin-like protein (Dps family)
MNDFLKKIIGDLEAKKEWKAVESRANALPEEYRVVYEEIKHFIWQGGAGVTDPSNLFGRLVDLFEEGAANGKQVLEVTGDDVAAFVGELLRGEKTYVEDMQEKLNRDIAKKLGK